MVLIYIRNVLKRHYSDYNKYYIEVILIYYCKIIILGNYRIRNEINQNNGVIEVKFRDSIKSIFF